MKRAGHSPVLISDAASVHRAPQERWTELFGNTAPKRPDGFVEQVVAWHDQALAHGDIPAHIRRDLNIALAQLRVSRQRRTGVTSSRGEIVLHAKSDALCTNFGVREAEANALCTRVEHGLPQPSNALCTNLGWSVRRHHPDRKDNGPTLPPASSQLLIGARLVKAYDGKTHVVEVTAEGMLYEGQLFGSLSAVAKRITGTHWNGLLFFDLRKRKHYDRKKRNA